MKNNIIAVIIWSLFSPTVLAQTAAEQAERNPYAPRPETSTEPTTMESESLLDSAPLNSETSTMKIVGIEVEGTAVKDSVLFTMDTKPGAEVSPEDIRNDLRNIYSLGYFLDVSAVRQPAPGGYILIVKVVENPVLKEIKISNDLQVVSKAEILEIFQDQLGKIGNYNDIQKSKEKIEEIYRSKGYALANLRFIQDKTLNNYGLISPEGILEVQLNEGVIEAIRVDGNKETKDFVILREITLKPGDIFDSKQMQADLRRVFNTNFFEGIDLSPKPGEKDQNHWIITVNVKEKPTGSVNMGAGFNNRDGLIGTFSILKDNLMGEGRRVGVDLQFGVDVLSIFSQNTTFNQAQRTLLGRIDFYDPWMFEERTSFGASIFSERIPLFFGSGAQQNIFNLNLGNGIIQSRVGTSVNFGRPLFGDLTSPWRGSVSVRAEQVGVTDLNREPRRDLSVSNRFSATDVFFSVGGSLSYDTRDIIMNPTTGWYGLASLEPVWGDSAYLKLTGNISTYLGVTDWLTFAFGVRGGSLLGENPPYEQFYSNGFNVVRGWPENGFLFGKHFAIGSVEARFPIFDPIAGVVFADIGEFLPVSADRQDLNQGLPFKYGVGLGLRLNTPMGPLRLDYGIRDFSKLNFATLLGEAGQLHFSIGQKF